MKLWMQMKIAETIRQVTKVETRDGQERKVLLVENVPSQGTRVNEKGAQGMIFSFAYANDPLNRFIQLLLYSIISMLKLIICQLNTSGRVQKIDALVEGVPGQDLVIDVDDQNRKKRAVQKRAPGTVQDQKIKNVVKESVDVQKKGIVSPEEVALRKVGHKGAEHLNI